MTVDVGFSTAQFDSTFPTFADFVTTRDVVSFRLSFYSRGVRHDCGTARNEATTINGILGLINPAYLPFQSISVLQFLVNGNRLSQEPACRPFEGFLVLLHCCRNMHFFFDNRRGSVSFKLFASSNGYGDGNFVILSRVFSPTHSCQV